MTSNAKYVLMLIHISDMILYMNKDKEIVYMPHPNVTVYDLLLSCPGDVLDLKDIIEECITSFNNTIGKINNVRIELKHWSTDSFPQSGGKPQNLLNNQFVNDCDLCVALIGTRFGTPTDNYDSGTEEEIEIMLAQNKQVFLYFIERKVDQSTIDLEQLAKVKSFKEKYTDKGIYSVIKSEEQLRKEFQNAITMYFLKIVAPTTTELHPTFAPNLIITTESDETTIISLYNGRYKNIKLLLEKENAIRDLITVIDGLVVVPSETPEESSTPKLSNEQKEHMTVGEIMKAREDGSLSKAEYYTMLGKKPPVCKKVELFSEHIKLVEDFCTKKGVTLSEDFWDLGNLHCETSNPVFKIMNTMSTEYIGSNSEKEKHRLIKELIKKIEDYSDAEEYFSQLSSLYITSLVVNNAGTTFDEDIDVKICVDKGHLLSLDSIPIPGVHFIEEVVEADAVKYLFSAHSNADIEAFSNYPVQPYVPELIDLPFKSRKEELNECKQKYSDSLDDILCYKVHQTEEEDVLCFNIPYLKQNTKMYFPSYLFFASVPKYIRYEIRSKHSPNVYTKKFEVQTIEK